MLGRATDNELCQSNLFTPAHRRRSPAPFFMLTANQKLNNDLMHAHVIPEYLVPIFSFLMAGISVGYLIIAYQYRLLFSHVDHNKRAVKSLRLLILIFLMCSISRYGFKLFGEAAAAIEIASHSLLFVVTWMYILTNQAGIVANALVGGDEKKNDS